MKPSYEWKEEDILMLIENQIQEDSYREYKRCDALRTSPQKKRDNVINEISKDVSSFANADGGTIVYGVIEKNQIPTKIADNPFPPDELTKEWLENIIDSNIKRIIDGIRIISIELSQTNPGKHIYVVYIPQSLQGAHQAKDLKYYQRRNFKAEPMEDYQVRDVMNRFKCPVLELEYKFYSEFMGTARHIYGL